MGTATSKQPHQQTPSPPEPSPFTPPVTYTCEICIEPISNIQKFKNNHHCDHSFCTDCVTKYITFKVTDDMENYVACLGLTCNFTLDPLTCCKLLPKDAFIKWCDNLCHQNIIGLDRCYCPNRDCSTMVISECSSDARKAKCPDCKRLFCSKCGVEWHAGYRCGETVDIRDQNDVKFGVLAEQKRWMRCPKCCFCIELVAGCNLVKCRCQTCFCYKCGKMIKIRCDCRVSDLYEDGQRDEPTMPDRAVNPLPFRLFILFILVVIIAGTIAGKTIDAKA